MTRLRGRSKRGARLNASAPFGAWGTQTFIAGLTHEDLIAPWVIKGAMDADAFATYIRDVLIPEIKPWTVVIATISQPTRTLKLQRHFEIMGVGFFFCLPIVQI